ncbi:hypothetical protein E4U19_003439 [Claviceps sp. Clav32 group G5]|nr:hypothetical protein E4U19_003439 [Claviceps sp. Clav32 group G5]
MKDHSSHNVKKVDDVVGLLDSLQVHLTSGSLQDAGLEHLSARLQSAIHLVNFWLTNPTTLDKLTRPKDLDSQCCKLWNICVRERMSWTAQRSESERNAGDTNTALMSVWLLSFLCLELSRGLFNKPGDQAEEASYMMELMVPLVKASINDANFETARLALQRGAAHLDNLNLAAGRGEKEPAEDKVCFSFQAKYYAMRIWLAWQENCLDVAEHMYTKTAVLHAGIDAGSIEFLADILQRVGSDLISKDIVDVGLTWIQRAYSVLCSQAGALTSQGENLYLAVCNDLITYLLPGSPFEHPEQVENIIQQAQPVLGRSPMWCHWWLRARNSVERDSQCNEDQYVQVLKRLIVTTGSQDNLLPLVWNHVKNFRRRTPACAAKLLSQLLLQPSLDAHCVGKILFLRVSIMSDKTTHDKECEELSDVVNQMHQQMPTAIPSATVELCHSLIWEMTKSASALEHVDLVQFWCELALRPLFRSTSIQGIDRFFRKLLLCGMKRNELSIYDYEADAMPSFCGDDDRELGCQSLQKLASTTDVHRGQELLYASLSQAGHGPDRELILSILKHLSLSCHESGAETVNLPLLLRCAIRILRMAERDQYGRMQDVNEADLASDTCSLFEIAAESAVSDAESNRVNRRFPVQELDWFRRNAYNLGILTSSEWQPPYTARILNSCIALTECYPADDALSQTTAVDLALTTLRCHFVIAVSLLKQARTEEDASSHVQHYQELRHHVAEYDATLHRKRLAFDVHTHDDLTMKYTTLLVYDFEAAMQLSRFTELRGIIDRQKPYGNVQAYKTMGDMLLQSSNTPPEVLLTTLKHLINEIHTLEAFNAAKLAKYLRCLFHVLLPRNDALALSILDHFAQLSLEAKAVNTKVDVEREWFVARTFNHALDYYVRFEEQGCRVWAGRAMQMAEEMDDGGILAGALRERLEHLQFRGGGTFWKEAENV